MNIKNLTVRYGDNTVYENFNLEAEEGKITCVLGESGCGKTTLLNAVADLIPHTGETPKVKCSYVFQEHRLLEGVTVLKNLTVVGADPSAAAEMLKRVGLEDKSNAYPGTLSGGEAQRISLCRAFLYPSDILLMDEPFSSLDLKTKLSVMSIFKAMQNAESKTTLFVTHDIDEALYLADKIAVLGKGKIIDVFDNANKSGFGANTIEREKIIKLILAN